MKNCLTRNAFLFFVLLLLPTLSLASRFTVTRVYDGDTITADGYDIEIKLRLPETVAIYLQRNE